MAFKDKGKWRVTWRENSRRYSKNFPKGTPKSVVDRFEAEVKLGRARDLLDRETPTFEEWSEVWMTGYAALHKEDSSRIKDRGILKKHLIPALGHLGIDQISPTNLLDLQKSLWDEGEGYAAQSVNNVISLVSSILKFAVQHRVLGSNPCASVKRIPRKERPPTFWTFEETDRFLNYCSSKDWKLFQLCAFAVNTGLRPGELQGLLRDCLDFNLGYVHVRRNWCTKTNRLNEYTKTKVDRKVSIPQAVLQILRDKSPLAPNSHVFDLPFNTLGWKMIRPMAIAAGVKSIRFHDLRHTFASHLVMRGKHPVEIKEVLGHTKLDTTMKYMHLAEDRNKGLTDCLTEGMSWVNQGEAEVIPFRNSFS